MGLSAVLGDEVSNNPKHTQLAMISEIFNASVNYTYIKYLAVCVYIYIWYLDMCIFFLMRVNLVSTVYSVY